MSTPDEDLGFAPEDDAPIPHMQRIRDYYLAFDYPTPYRWAHYADVPFRPLEKPLSRCRVALITTAAPYQPDKGDQGRVPPTMRQPNSTRFIRGTAQRTTICGFRISPSTARTQLRKTATPGFRCRNCGAAPRRA